MSTGHVHAIPDITTWDDYRSATTGAHACYFCRPHRYPKMPDGCTLCACCGVFMWTGDDDPMNESMLVCETCDAELATEPEREPVSIDDLETAIDACLQRANKRFDAAISLIRYPWPMSPLAA